MASLHCDSGKCLRSMHSVSSFELVKKAHGSDIRGVDADLNNELNGTN